MAFGNELKRIMEILIRSRILMWGLLGLAMACDLSNEPSQDFGEEQTFLKVYGGGDDHIGIEGHPLAEGGYILAGNSQIDNSVESLLRGQGLQGFMKMIKTDELGNVLWETVPDTSSYNVVTAMAVDGEENYVMAGSTVSLDSPSIASADVRVSKVGSNGDLLWSRNYGDVVRRGGDIARDVHVASNGDYLVIGLTTGVPGSITNLISNTDIYALRISAVDGSVIWEKTYGLSGLIADTGIAIKEDRNGNLVWLGRVQVGINNDRMRLVKSNGDGNILWDFDYELDGDSQVPGDLLITPAGYTAMGVSGSSYALFHTNTSGQLLWQKAFTEIEGAQPFPTSISLSRDGFLLLAGTYRLGNDNNDQFLIKAKTGGGELLWHRVYGEGDHDVAAKVCATADGGILISGTLGFSSNSLMSLIKTDAEGRLSE